MPSEQGVTYIDFGLNSVAELWDRLIVPGVRTFVQEPPLARHSMLPFSYGTCMIGSGTKDILTKTTTGQGSTPCTYRKLDSSVAVMQAADHGLGNDPTKPCDRSAYRRILA